MMPRYQFLLLVMFCFFNRGEAILWPLEMQNESHPLVVTYGDWNGSEVIPAVTMGYHGGSDIRADAGTAFYSVSEGVITRCCTDSIGYDGFINIATDTSGVLAWHYSHVNLKRHPSGDTLRRGDAITISESLGVVADFPDPCFDHIHFQRSHPMYTELTGYLNPLDRLLPSPSQAPCIFPRQEQHHQYCIYYVSDKCEDTIGYYETTYVRDSVDIIVWAGTTIQDQSFAGAYRIGHGIQPKTAGGGSIPFSAMFEMRDTISASDSLRYYLTYADSVSQNYDNWYIVTNCDTGAPHQDSSGLSNIKENCWPTKMNIAGTADADSIEDARFPDGYYVTTIKVWSHSNDSAVALDTVLVDNFNPRVKESRPNDWFAFVPTMEKRAWCTFSEQMDTSTLNSANIKIQSLRADSFNYVITNLIYDDSICKLTLEVDSFRFKDTVQVRLLDGVRATGLWGQLVKSMSGYMERSVTCVQVGTDGECAKMAHQRAPGCNNINAWQDAVLRPRHGRSWRDPLRSQELDTGHASGIMV